SNLLGERIAEVIITTPKIINGRFKGDITKTNFFSMKILIAQQRSTIAVAAIRRTCFGSIKKSVIPVKKNVGRRKIVTVITTVVIVSNQPRVPCLSMMVKLYK